jgi:hypothetical protein
LAIKKNEIKESNVMKPSLLFFFIAILFANCATTPVGGEKVEDTDPVILVTNLDADSDFLVDRSFFHSVHLLYYYLFGRLEFDDRVTRQIKAELIYNVWRYIDFDCKVHFQVPNYRNGETLKVNYGFLTASDGSKDFFMTTNYDGPNDIILNESQLMDAYAVLFGYTEDKIFYFRDKTSMENRAKAEAKGPNYLADYLLFNSSSEDDAEALVVLKDYIATGEDLIENAFCHFTLAQVYAAEGDFAQAFEVLDTVNTIIEAEPQLQPLAKIQPKVLEQIQIAEYLDRYIRLQREEGTF